ncbi:MAG: OmpA family protein [Tistlia sp.]
MGAGLVLASALAGLSACSAYDELFSDEPVPGIVTTGSGDQQDAVVPSLASVPGRPTPSSAAQRQALQESLRVDRSRAVYSDQPAERLRTGTSDATAEATAEAVRGDVERPDLPEAPAAPAASDGFQPLPEPSQATRSEPRSQPQSQPGSQGETSARSRPPSPAPSYDTRPDPSESRAALPTPAVGPAQIQQYNLPQRPSYSELAGVIFFGYGSSALDQRDLGVLRQIVQLQQQRGGTLRVVGHASLLTGVTDPVKHNLANFDVSLKRAQSVARRLETLGAPAVVVEAMGSAQPVYYEFMPTCEAGNRRAEIFLDY